MKIRDFANVRDSEISAITKTDIASQTADGVDTHLLQVYLKSGQIITIPYESKDTRNEDYNLLSSVLK